MSLFYSVSSWNVNLISLSLYSPLFPRFCSPEAAAVNWNDENIQVMLTTVKEWCMLCHDEVEVENLLSKGQPLWDEVAYNLSRSVKKCPFVCKDFFDLVSHLRFVSFLFYKWFTFILHQALLCLLNNVLF